MDNFTEHVRQHVRLGILMALRDRGPIEPANMREEAERSDREAALASPGQFTEWLLELEHEGFIERSDDGSNGGWGNDRTPPRELLLIADPGRQLLGDPADPEN